MTDEFMKVIPGQALLCTSKKEREHERHILRQAPCHALHARRGSAGEERRAQAGSSRAVNS
jgi:hypothetical protein